MLTKPQIILLKRLQRAAGLADADYRALFPEVTGFADCRSSTDGRLTNEHMDALKGRLLALARPADLNAQLRQQDMPRRRAEHPLVDLQKCLGVYVPDVAGYVATVIADKFGVPAGGALTLDDLSDQPRVWRGANGKLVEGPSQVKQLIMTLAARVQAKRKAAKDSIHDMRQKAGVACYCRICCPPGQVRLVIERGDADESGAAEPVGVGAEEAEGPF